MLLCLVEEAKDVLVSHVAEDPLDPNAVVFLFEFELLQALAVQLAYFLFFHVLGDFS